MDSMGLKPKKRTKKVIMPPSVMVNQPNLRQILLDKLMKHRKTQKRVEPVIYNNNFDQQCEPAANPATPTNPITVESPISDITPDKPYGVLKNGTKPTFKVWNKTQKIHSRPDEPTVQVIPVTATVVPSLNSQAVNSQQTTVNDMDPPIELATEPFDSFLPSPSLDPGLASKVFEKPSEPDPIPEPVSKIKVGKNKKTRTVQVLIPCSQTRKIRSELQDSLRKTNLSTLKNYLKQRRLVKVGSTAPTNLLRQIYENAKAYGDVINENKDALLHNYEKDEKE